MMRQPIESLVRLLLAAIFAVALGSCRDNGAQSSTTVDLAISSNWGKPFIHATDNQGLTQSKKVTDSNANTTLLWTTREAQRTHVWAQRYDSKRRAWDDATQLDDNDLSETVFITLEAAVDNGGNVAVLWTAVSYSADYTPLAKLRTTRYVAARASWDATTAVHDLHNLEHAQLILDHSGYAAIVWWESLAGRYRLWATSMSTAGAWTTPQRVDSADSDSPLPYEIRFDAEGTTTLAWLQEDNEFCNLWVTRHPSNGAWETAKTLNTQNTESVLKFKAAVDPLGNVTLVWGQHTGTISGTNASNARLLSARIPVGAILVDTTIPVIPVDLAFNTEPGAYSWDLVGNGAGKFTLIWCEAESNTSSAKVWARTLTVGGDWSEAVSVYANADFNSLYDIKAVIDSIGNVTAVWNTYRDPGMANHHFANRMTVAGVWGTSTKITNIEDHATGHSIGLDLHQDVHGNVLLMSFESSSNAYRGDWFRVTRIDARHPFDSTPLNSVTLGESLSFPPQITFGASGTAIVSWLKNGAFGPDVYVRSVSADGTWGSAVSLDEPVAIGSLAPVVVQDQKGVATLVWRRLLQTGAVRMRTARFSNSEWITGPDATVPTDEKNVINIPHSLWLDANDTPVLTVETYERQNRRSTLWSVAYPESELLLFPAD